MFTDPPSLNARGVPVSFGPGSIVRTPANLTDVADYDWPKGSPTLNYLARSLGTHDSGGTLERQALLQALEQGAWNRNSPLLEQREANILGMVLSPIPNVNSGLWLVGYGPDYTQPGVYHYRELTPEPSDGVARAALASSLLGQIVQRQVETHRQFEAFVRAFTYFAALLQSSSSAPRLLEPLPVPFVDNTYFNQYAEPDPDDPHGWRFLTGVLKECMEDNLATSADMTTRLVEALDGLSAMYLERFNKSMEIDEP